MARLNRVIGAETYYIGWYEIVKLSVRILNFKNLVWKKFQKNNKQ